MPGGHHQISEPTLTTVFIGLLARFGPFWACCGMFLLPFKDFGGIRLIRLSLFARVQVCECSQFNGLDEGRINSLQKRTRLSPDPFGLVVSFRKFPQQKIGRKLFPSRTTLAGTDLGSVVTWADTTLAKKTFVTTNPTPPSRGQPTSCEKFSFLLGLVLFDFVVPQQQTWLKA